MWCVSPECDKADQPTACLQATSPKAAMWMFRLHDVTAVDPTVSFRGLLGFSSAQMENIENLFATIEGPDRER